MCLSTTQKKALIAKEDITVYKECIVRDNFLTAYCVTGHKYAKIETAPLRNQVSDYNPDRRVISSGLHAYLTDASCNNTKWIIPKGSKYYQGDSSSYVVSNKLIFVEFINNLKWLEEDVKTGGVNLKWAKPSIKRFYTKWKRYFDANY